MTTFDEDRIGEEGKPKKESADEKRKEPASHIDRDHVAHAVREDRATATSNFIDMSRSERKRDREKKRRGDVNRGLDELQALLFLIDPELKAEAEERRRKSHNKPVHSTEPEPMISRVELINSAVTVLRRIHRENEERKVVISHLATGLLSATRGNGGQQALAPAFAAAHPHHLARPTDMQVLPFG